MQHRTRFTPDRNRPAFHWLRVVCVLATSAATLGCLSEGTIIGFFLGGPPSVEPEFDKVTGLSMTDKDVTVAVVCFAPNELKWDFDKVDDDVAKYLSHRLNEHAIRVIAPERVRDWLDRNPDWDKPEEIGAAFECTYVIYIDLHKYSLYEKGSAHLYRGQAEAMVSVWKMEDDVGDKVFSKELVSQYPHAVPRSTSEVTFSKFKRQYLSHLSNRIGWLFYEHYNGDEMVDAT